jgi:hypothetical protein
MADAQHDHGITVVDREPLGFAEPGTPGQRTWDPAYAYALGEAARVNQLGGLIYHTQAGLAASVAQFGPSHRTGAVEVVRGLAGYGASGPVPPIPPIIPPVTGHPILDAPMSPEYPVGYAFWIAQRPAITAEVVAWYVRAHGHQPAESDIAHGLWRCVNECDRWQTMRNALENTWPGGAPPA